MLLHQRHRQGSGSPSPAIEWSIGIINWRPQHATSLGSRHSQVWETADFIWVDFWLPELSWKKCLPMAGPGSRLNHWKSGRERSSGAAWPSLFFRFNVCWSWTPTTWPGEALWVMSRCANVSRLRMILRFEAKKRNPTPSLRTMFRIIWPLPQPAQPICTTFIRTEGILLSHFMAARDHGFPELVWHGSPVWNSPQKCGCV